MGNDTNKIMIPDEVVMDKIYLILGQKGMLDNLTNLSGKKLK